MKSLFQAAASRSQEDRAPSPNSDGKALAFQRREPELERQSFDLISALLPEWPAEACSWA
ncbi:MAG TPA: hypothetical protein VK524_06930 [Polyangiaceae bacterium]|nr:hypothetical protein [Polyangiaceae bacterium]